LFGEETAAEIKRIVAALQRRRALMAEKKEDCVPVEIVDKGVGWATSQNRYWVVSRTADKLPAGVYTIGSSTRIGVYLDLVKLVSDELIVLPGMGAEEILEEIEIFYEARDRYKKRGMLHKRGILMTGDPGSGKTSNASLVIDKFVREVGGVVLAPNDVGGLYGGIALVRDREPDRPILVVLEDIDGIARQHEEVLLNILDGRHQHDGVVVVATTNYLHKLPDRIANRPSRFDLVVTIAMPSLDARRMFIRAKEPEMREQDVEMLAEASGGWSIAHVKELLILTQVCEMPVDRAIERVRAITERKLIPEQGALRVKKVEASEEGGAEDEREAA
jgi:hypothetical protein